MKSERLYRDKEWLEEKYIEEELSSCDIAEICSVTKTTILRWLDKFDIPVRSVKDAVGTGHSRAKVSQARKDWWETDDGKRAKDKLRKRNRSEKQRKAVSEAKKGTTHSEKTKQKIGEKTRERFEDVGFRRKHQKASAKANKDPEKRKRVSEALKGSSDSEETRKKKSEAAQRHWRDPEYRKKVFKEWTPNRETDIEGIVRVELEKREIKYEKNTPFPEFSTIPDFYLPNQNVILYCDGEYWHSSPKRNLKDTRQKEDLEADGYRVWRLRGNDIKNDIETLLDRIGLGKQPRIKLAVGVPSATEYLHRRFVESLMSLQYPPNTDIQFICVYGKQLPFARNHIIEQALDANADYLLWVDSDQTYPPHALKRLVKHDKDFVSALAFRRGAPHYPALFEWIEGKNCYETMDYSEAKGGLMKVDACGMPFTLVKTKVFKNMERPWFYYREHFFSSDMTFCWEAQKQLGIDLYVDTGLKIGHLGSAKEITEQDYLRQLNPEAKRKWNENMKKLVKKHRAREKELYREDE